MVASSQVDTMKVLGLLCVFLVSSSASAPAFAAKGSKVGASRKTKVVPKLLGKFTTADVFQALHPEATKEAYLAIHRSAKESEVIPVAGLILREDGRLVPWDGKDPKSTPEGTYRNIVVDPSTMEIISAKWKAGAPVFTATRESVRAIEWRGGPGKVVAAVIWAPLKEGSQGMMVWGGSGWSEVALLSERDGRLVVDARSSTPIFAILEPTALPLSLSKSTIGIEFRHKRDMPGKLWCAFVESTEIVQQVGSRLTPVLWVPTTYCDNTIDQPDEGNPICVPCARKAPVRSDTTIEHEGYYDLVWALKMERRPPGIGGPGSDTRSRSEKWMPSSTSACAVACGQQA